LFNGFNSFIHTLTILITETHITYAKNMYHKTTGILHSIKSF